MRNSLKRWLMMVGVLFGVLTPVVQAPPTLQTVRGVWKGRVRIADDFDELPEEIAGELGIA